MPLQDRIGKIIQDGKYAAMYSLDLSSAFDMIDSKLFYERMRHRGIPDHLSDILMDFITEQDMFIQYEEENSMIRKLEYGCVQGSILGPIIFNLYISPIGEIVEKNITGYADDSYDVCQSSNLEYLKREVEKSLEKHIRWLKDSGLVVNESKTENIIFHRTENIKEKIKIGKEEIETKKELKALGITLQQNLRWGPQVKKKETVVNQLSGD